MPHRIIITTPGLKMSLKAEKQSKYEAEPSKTLPNISYETYASSLLKQSELILEYFDKCMTKMGESKDIEIRSKIGSEIDFFAGGLSDYLEFRKNILDEALKGVRSLKINDDAKGALSKAGSDLNMVMG